MSSDPGRFEALLSHQGPLVHVDHFNRAPAPTANDCAWWDSACREREAEKQRRVVKRGWQEQGKRGTHTISVTAGQVRKVLEQRSTKQEYAYWIEQPGSADNVHVKFAIDKNENVWYTIWESGNYNSPFVGDNYRWSKNQNDEYLYAPNEKLKQVLETAAQKLLEMPPE